MINFPPLFLLFSNQFTRADKIFKIYYSNLQNERNLQNIYNYNKLVLKKQLTFNFFILKKYLNQYQFTFLLFLLHSFISIWNNYTSSKSVYNKSYHRIYF